MDIYIIGKTYRILQLLRRLDIFYRIMGVYGRGWVKDTHIQIWDVSGFSYVFTITLDEL